MNGLKTSFATFRLATRNKPQLKQVQKIRTRGNWLIRGDKQKCLECRGIPRIILGGNGRLAGFYPVNIPYPHKENCKNVK